MPYYAENKEQADNGLQFWRDDPQNPETHQAVYSLGQFVLIKKEDQTKCIH